MPRGTVRTQTDPAVNPPSRRNRTSTQPSKQLRCFSPTSLAQPNWRPAFRRMKPTRSAAATFPYFARPWLKQVVLRSRMSGTALWWRFRPRPVPSRVRSACNSGSGSTIARLITLSVFGSDSAPARSRWRNRTISVIPWLKQPACVQRVRADKSSPQTWSAPTAGRRSLHAFASLGVLSLKGLPHPVAALQLQWEPLGEKESVPSIPLPTRMATRPRTGLVGREVEIEAITSSVKRGDTRRWTRNRTDRRRGGARQDDARRRSESNRIRCGNLRPLRPLRKRISRRRTSCLPRPSGTTSPTPPKSSCSNTWRRSDLSGLGWCRP